MPSTATPVPPSRRGFGSMLVSGLVLQRVAAAAAAPIEAHAIAATVISLAGVAAVSLPFGMYTKFLLIPKRRPGDLGAAAIAAGTARAFFAPGILEELFWRAALLPHPAADPSLRFTPISLGLTLALSNAAFIYMHVINAKISERIGRRGPAEAFRDPRFLTLAGVIGAACSACYLATGSLWAAVVVHWLPVSVWLFALGGAERLRLFKDGGPDGDT